MLDSVDGIFNLAFPFLLQVNRTQAPDLLCNKKEEKSVKLAISLGGNSNKTSAKNVLRLKRRFQADWQSNYRKRTKETN